MIYAPLMLRRVWGLRSFTMAYDHAITEHSNQLQLNRPVTPIRGDVICVAKCKVIHLGKRNASFHTSTVVERRYFAGELSLSCA